MIQKFLFLWYKKSWVKSLGFVKNDRTWSFSDRQWMWVLSGFSMVFDSSHLSCHYSVIIFIFKSRIFEMGEHFLYFYNVFNFMKMAIMERREPVTMLWRNQGRARTPEQQRGSGLQGEWGGAFSPACVVPSSRSNLAVRTTIAASIRLAKKPVKFFL